MASSTRSWLQELTAATLSAGSGACVSHRAAAALLKIAGFAPGIVEISSLRDVRVQRRGIIVHRASALPSCDTTAIATIPVTEASRTLIDLAGMVSMETLEVALDDALRRRITTIRRLQWRLNNVGARGKSGVSVLQRLMAERPIGTVAPESPLEGRFIRLLRRAGLPPPERQFEIRDGRKRVARVDFAYPEHRLAIEVDGYAYHSGKSRWEKDLARRNAIEALSWSVLNVTKRQIDDKDNGIVSIISRVVDEHFSYKGCAR